MSISNVTQFAGALRAQLNLQVDTENTQSVSPNSTSEFLSQTVSSLDLSGAEYGTLLIKDKLHDQAYAYSVVTIKQRHLSSLNTYIQNVQDVVDLSALYCFSSASQRSRSRGRWTACLYTGCKWQSKLKSKWEFLSHIFEYYNNFGNGSADFRSSNCIYCNYKSVVDVKQGSEKHITKHCQWQKKVGNLNRFKYSQKIHN